MATTIDDILNNGSGSKLVTTPWANGGQTTNGATQGGTAASGGQTTNATTNATPMKPAVGNGYTYLQDKDGELTPAPGTPGAAQAATQAATQDAPKGVQAATPEEVEALAASIKPAEVTKPEALAQQKADGSDYDKLIAELEARRARHEKDRKRERQERLIYAIGDGIAALGGLVTASTKGGVSAYNPKMTMSQAAQERWDRYHKERDEDEKGYLDEYLKVMNAKRADEIAKSNNWYKEQQIRYRQEKLKGEMDVLAARAEDLRAQGRVREADAVLKQMKAKVEELEAEGVKINNEWIALINGAKVDNYRSQAVKNYALADKAESGGGGGGNSKDKTVVKTKKLDENGNEQETTTTTYGGSNNNNGGKRKALPKGLKELPK